MRFNRESICQSLLLLPPRKKFLEELLTGDVKWVLYDSNAHRDFWLSRREEPPRESKVERAPQESYSMLPLRREGNPVLRAASKRVHGHRCLLRHLTPETRGSFSGQPLKTTLSTFFMITPDLM